MVFMKLTALQALIAAVDEGSLRAAARRVGVSQPALSKGVRELELELGATLLQRTSKGVQPTPQGRVLVDHARKAVRELDAAVTQINQIGGRMVGQLRIAAVPLAVPTLIPETLRTYSREFPDIQLQLREELYLAQLGPLRQGDADVAIGPIPDQLPAGEFQVEPLMPIDLVVVAGQGSALARARSLRELAGARWVYTSPSGHAGYAHLLFTRHGLPPPEPAAIVNSTLALLALIGGGDCVGLMPRPFASHPAAWPHLSVVPIEEGPLSLTLGAMVRPDAALKPAVRGFLTHLQRAVAHLPETWLSALSTVTAPSTPGSRGPDRTGAR